MKTTIILGIVAWTTGLLLSCTADDYYYKELIDGKDQIYPGKISDVSYSSGHNRFALDFVLSKDQQVNELLIYWNNKADSIVKTIGEDEIGKSKQVIVDGIPENAYDFEVYTRNIHKVRSVPTKVFGRVYGEQYIATLNNRAFLQSGVSSGRVWVEWIPETREDYIYTKITYTTTTDQEVVVELPRPASGADWRYLDNYKRGTKIFYQAAFRPLEQTLDVYFSPANSVIVP